MHAIGTRDRQGNEEDIVVYIAVATANGRGEAYGTPLLQAKLIGGLYGYPLVDLVGTVEASLVHLRVEIVPCAPGELRRGAHLQEAPWLIRQRSSNAVDVHGTGHPSDCAIAPRIRQ